MESCNLSLFDYDYQSHKANKCEVNHFHIYIEGDISWPFEKNNDHMKGVFMHEYIHYLQHLSTLCGISLSRHYNLLFCSYREYFSVNETIPVPLSYTDVAPYLISFFECFNRIKGHRKYWNRLDKVKVSNKEISLARIEQRSVRLDTYNEETNQWSDADLEFGYYAIIEGMADLIQRIYEPDVVHGDVPYHVVKRVCEAVYPEVKDDFLMMISLCICSLMSSNPGVGFFEAVECAKNHPGLNGLELYRVYVKGSTIILSKNKRTTIASWFEHQLTQYQATIQQALGVTDYYSKAIDSALKCAQTGDNLLLSVLYDSIITPDMYFQCLADYYGSPYIEAHNDSLVPGHSKKPVGVVAAIGLEMLYKSLISEPSASCPRVDQCKRINRYSYECVNGNHWSREEMCPFKAAMHYYRIDNKKVEFKNTK